MDKDINEPNKDSLNCYMTVQYNITNITAVNHSTKPPGHITINTPAQPQVRHNDSLKDWNDNTMPENGTSPVSKSETLLSNILKQFEQEIVLTKGRV